MKNDIKDMLHTLVIVQSLKSTAEASMTGIAFVNAFFADTPQVRVLYIVSGTVVGALCVIDAATTSVAAYIHSKLPQSRGE